MPIYSYKCENCGRIFDKFQKVGGEGNIKCVYCDSNANRLFSPVGIIFKGSGFYTTDYKSSSGNFNNTSVSTNKEKDNKKSKTKSSDKKETSSVSDKKNN
jgi:putative FmdB family regulatory protein